MLLLKINRSQEARNILKGVKYKYCPSCALELIARPENQCNVCGKDIPRSIDDMAIHNIETDSKQRIDELKDSISRHSRQLKIIGRRIEEKKTEKINLDNKLNKILLEYNSSYLANVLALEEEKFSLQENINSLKTIQELHSKANKLLEEANELTPEINDKNNELKVQREKAERDTQNLRKLEDNFLHFLLRSKFTGIKSEDKVQILSPHFLPEVIDMKAGDLATTSFSNVSSGGKKTLFKCCFALAFHALALENKTILPTLLILDSPMKNISERENKDVFQSFLNLVYELHNEELKGVQIIIVDKEFYGPTAESKINIFERHMMPNSDENPPLIPYYKGH